VPPEPAIDLSENSWENDESGRELVSGRAASLEVLVRTGCLRVIGRVAVSQVVGTVMVSLVM
jgi:hypothetical protein